MDLGVLFNTDRLDHAEFTDYARRLEELGYESLWLPELFTRDPFAAAGFILARTSKLKLATGIANVYARDPAATVAAASTLQELSEGRFILGLGVSNARLPDAELAKHCGVGDDSWVLLESAAERFHLSARSQQRVLRVARTIADLAGAKKTAPPHVAEALSLRCLDRRTGY